MTIHIYEYSISSAVQDPFEDRHSASQEVSAFLRLDMFNAIVTRASQFALT
jgi:hypothetical protein